MRHAVIGLCIIAAACSQTPSPTAPSGGAGAAAAQTQARGNDPVEVTFTKWITAYPAMAGITEEGGVPGTFAGTVLSADPFDNGTVVQVEAQYGVTAADPAHSFVARIAGTQNNRTQQAVLNGTVTSGWLIGARVHVTFDIIAPEPGKSCEPTAPMNTRCFRGTIRIMPGSAD